MTSTRIYVVEINAGMVSKRLVRAANKSQSINHVSGDMMESHVASQDELVELLQSGVEIEEIGNSQQSGLFVGADDEA